MNKRLAAVIGLLLASMLLTSGCYLLKGGVRRSTPSPLLLTSSSYSCVTGKQAMYSVSFTPGQQVVEVGHNTVYLWGLLPVPRHETYAKLVVSCPAAMVKQKLADISVVVQLEGTDSADFRFTWPVGRIENNGEPLYPSGLYQVQVRLFEANSNLDDKEAVSFEVNVDNTAPRGLITYINDCRASGADTFFTIHYSQPAEESDFWVEWSDSLTPDDSVQAHNQVQLWCKPIHFPNQLAAWQPCGYQPSPCNPHWVVADNQLAAVGDSLCVVAAVMDEWGNGSLDAAVAMEAFAAGRYVYVVVDTTIGRRI